MKRNYKILLVVVIAIILAGAGYFIYKEYNISKVEFYLNSSLNHQKAANESINLATTFENNNDYSNAIKTLQKSSDEISNALVDDNNAVPLAEGVYSDYLNNDIALLQSASKLIEYKIYVDHYKNNDLNPGQEKVDPNKLYPFMNNLQNDISTHKDKENQIISDNPQEFKFLK